MNSSFAYTHGLIFTLVVAWCRTKTTEISSNTAKGFATTARNVPTMLPADEFKSEFVSSRPQTAEKWLVHAMKPKVKSTNKIEAPVRAIIPTFSFIMTPLNIDDNDG